MQFRQCQSSSGHRKVKIKIGHTSRKKKKKEGEPREVERHLRYVKVREEGVWGEGEEGLKAGEDLGR